MSDQLLALKLFTGIARTASFSQAARELKLSQPTASKMITQLEKQLGVTLLVRTTRATKLTDAGARYLERIVPVLAALEEAARSARGSGELQGILRVGLSSIFASRTIVPRLGAFLDKHPALRVELLVDDRRQHLVNERVDVALRFGKLVDSAATARRIGAWPILVAGSSAYLRRYGAPTHPRELETHRVVVGGPAAGGVWLFKKGTQEVRVEVDGNVIVNASEVGINAGVAGLGLVAASYPALELALERGDLVRVLADWSLGDIEVHALFPTGQGASPAARLFVDFLALELQDI